MEWCQVMLGVVEVIVTGVVSGASVGLFPRVVVPVYVVVV